MTSPVMFGEKTAWCAFQTTDVERVCEVLFEDRKPRPVSWEEGVHAAYHWPDTGYAKILVTPAIDGFVLAMTQGSWRLGSSSSSAPGLSAEHGADRSAALAIDPDRVAARWSIDPNMLEERSDVPDTCWLGELYV